MMIHLATRNVKVLSIIDGIHGRFVGATSVHHDVLWNILGLHSLVKEALGFDLVKV